MVATMMREFTSTARKDGRWWVVQCDQQPGAISQVARLDQAPAHQREAIAFVADLQFSTRPSLSNSKKPTGSAMKPSPPPSSVPSVGVTQPRQ